MSDFYNFAKKYKDKKPANRDEEFQLAVIRALEVFDKDLKKIKKKGGIMELRSL